MTGPMDYMPGVPSAGHLVRGGYWHPGPKFSCSRCIAAMQPRAPRGGPITRHYDASRPVSAKQVAELRELAEGRVMPPLTSSSRVMILRINQVVRGESAVQYELNKLTDWLKRLPERNDDGSNG